MCRIGRLTLVSVSLAFYVILCFQSVTFANSGESRLEDFTDRIGANLATSQEIESFINGLSVSERESFGLLLASALQIPTQQWNRLINATSESGAYGLSSNTVFLGHDVTTNNLISSRRWYNNATKCDGDSSDVDRLFVYNISASGSHNFRWTAPRAGYLTAILILAYHTGGKPGIKGILSGSELHVCIGDTVVYAFSNEAIWGHNYIGRKLKVRQY